MDRAEVVVSAQDANSSVAENLRGRARRLQTVANELFVLANDLDGESVAQVGQEKDDGRWIEAARKMYRNRRLRAQVFAEDALFGEPAWDILLDLYIAAHEGKPVPVTSACIGAAVPTTTALRWIAVLETRGLIAREADASDARRIFVRLTDPGKRMMAEYFAHASRTELAEDIRRRPSASAPRRT